MLQLVSPHGRRRQQQQFQIKEEREDLGAMWAKPREEDICLLQPLSSCVDTP